jgi:hypothetical protein
MNTTNSISTAVAIAQSNGVHINGEQLSLILAAGAAVLRWVSLESKAGWKFWGEIGGWDGIKAYFNKGKTP